MVNYIPPDVVVEPCGSMMSLDDSDNACGCVLL